MVFLDERVRSSNRLRKENKWSTAKDSNSDPDSDPNPNQVRVQIQENKSKTENSSIKYVVERGGNSNGFISFHYSSNQGATDRDFACCEPCIGGGFNRYKQRVEAE